MTDQTQLKETALFFESIVPSLLGIIVKKPGITRCNEAPKHKTFLQLYMAAVLVPIQAVAYENQ